MKGRRFSPRRRPGSSNSTSRWIAVISTFMSLSSIVLASTGHDTNSGKYLHRLHNRQGNPRTSADATPLITTTTTTTTTSQNVPTITTTTTTTTKDPTTIPTTTTIPPTTTTQIPTAKAKTTTDDDTSTTTKKKLKDTTTTTTTPAPNLPSSAVTSSSSSSSSVTTLPTTNLTTSAAAMIIITLTSVITNADGSTSTALTPITTSTVANAKSNSSTANKKTVSIIGGVVGALVWLILILALSFKIAQSRGWGGDGKLGHFLQEPFGAGGLARKRGSSGQEIKWPELQPDGQTVSTGHAVLNPMGTRQTGGAGVSMGEKDDDDEYLGEGEDEEEELSGDSTLWDEVMLPDGTVVRQPSTKSGRGVRTTVQRTMTGSTARSRYTNASRGPESRSSHYDSYRSPSPEIAFQRPQSPQVMYAGGYVRPPSPQIHRAPLNPHLHRAPSIPHLHRAPSNSYLQRARSNSQLSRAPSNSQSMFHRAPYQQQGPPISQHGYYTHPNQNQNQSATSAMQPYPLLPLPSMPRLNTANPAPSSSSSLPSPSASAPSVHLFPLSTAPTRNGSYSSHHSHSQHSGAGSMNHHGATGGRTSPTIISPDRSNSNSSTSSHGSSSNGSNSKKSRVNVRVSTVPSPFEDQYPSQQQVGSGYGGGQNYSRFGELISADLYAPLDGVERKLSVRNM